MYEQHAVTKKIYDIDKRLAVLEALFKEKSDADQKMLRDMHAQMKEVQKSVDGLKVKVATISSGISVAVFFVAEMIAKYFKI